MTATHWLLLAITLSLASLLLFLWFVNRLQKVNTALDYRTIDVSTMEGDLRKLRAKVPTPAPMTPVRKNKVVSLDKAYRALLQQAEEAGEAAALLQIFQGIPGVNPHHKGSRAHLCWLIRFEATLEKQAIAEAARAAAVHARAQPVGCTANQQGD